MRSPRLARLLLGLSAPPSRCEDVLGDLEELHAQRVARFGGLVAWWVTWFDAVVMAVFLLAHRWTNRQGTSGSWISWPEVRLAFRQIRKRPLLNLVALVSLAVGMGLANAGFTFVDAVVFSELPYESGDRFVRFAVRARENGQRAGLSPARFHSLAQNVTALRYVGGWDQDRFNLFRASGEAEQIYGATISPDAFEFLPAQPLVGRTFARSDGEDGATPVALIRETLWESRYGRSPDIVGSVLDLDGTDRVVVGVMPHDFEFPNTPELWVPLDNRYLGATASEEPIGMQLFGILGPDVTRESAQDQVELLSRRFETMTPGAPELRLRLVSYTRSEDTADYLLVGSLLAVMMLVLLVIAANVGNLMLVRTASRSTEIAVRSALGAGRARLVGQLLAEAAALVSFAAVLGLVLSHTGLGWIERQIHAIEGDAWGFWIQLVPSVRTAVFIAGAAFVATAAVGLAPALEVTRGSPGSSLRSGASGPGAVALGRVGSGLTVIQMAMSVAFVGVSLIVARGALDFMHPDLGLPESEVLTAQIRVDRPTPAERSQSESGSWAQSIRSRRVDVLRAIETIAGVKSVGMASALPGDIPSPVMTEIQLLPGESMNGTGLASREAVLPGFFGALDVSPTAGRLLTETDLAIGALPVAVVNEPFAERFLGGRNAVGRRIRTVSHDGVGNVSEWREIVGVVPDLGLSVANPRYAAGYYVPMTSSLWVVQVAIRVEGDPRTFAAQLHEAVVRVHPEIEVQRVQLLEDVTRQSVRTLTLIGGSLVFLGGTALLLSLMGIYAITSLNVAQRTREIGIRVALGSSPGTILAAVSQRAVARLALGSALGMVLGTILAQFSSKSIRTGISAGGYWEIPMVALALGIAGVLACWVPARRALRVRPSEALRQ